jgi:hypothetical protein
MACRTVVHGIEVRTRADTFRAQVHVGIRLRPGFAPDAQVITHVTTREQIGELGFPEENELGP